MFLGLRTLGRLIKNENKIVHSTSSTTVGSRIYWDDIDKHTLSHLVGETETKASGRVQTVTLVDFRKSIGDLWEKYQDRIVLIADSTIARMIGRGNTYIAQDNDTWILLFPELAEEHAQELTDSIASAIGDKLMGAKFTPHEAPFPSTARLNFDRAVNSDGTVDVRALKNEVSKVRAAQVSASTGRKISATYKPEPLEKIPKAATARRKSSSSQFKSLLIPSWSADTECVDSFFFRAFTETNANVFQPGKEPVDPHDALDLFQKASAFFHDMLNTGLRAKFTIPLPFGVLTGPSLEHFHKMIAAFPQRQRLLQLRLEVTNIPESAGAENLVGIRERFRPFVRDVAFSTNPMYPNSQILALDHIVVGGDFIEERGLSDENLFQALLHFRHSVGRRTAFVLDLNSKAKIGAALRAGIHEIGGRGLADAQKYFPEKLNTISRKDLLSNQ